MAESSGSRWQDQDGESEAGPKQRVLHSVNSVPVNYGSLVGPSNALRPAAGIPLGSRYGGSGTSPSSLTAPQQYQSPQQTHVPSPANRSYVNNKIFSTGISKSINSSTVGSSSSSQNSPGGLIGTRSIDKSQESMSHSLQSQSQKTKVLCYSNTFQLWYELDVVHRLRLQPVRRSEPIKNLSDITHSQPMRGRQVIIPEARTHRRLLAQAKVVAR
jgi:hypothetical protein